MAEDTNNDTTEAEDEQSEMTFSEMMEFAEGRVQTETEDFPGDVPNHAGSLLVADIGALHGTLMNIQMAENSDEMPDPDDDAIANALADDAVDIILALGALSHEYGLDIASAFEERVETIEAHEKMEAAIEDADGQEEIMAAMEEHLGEDAMEQMMGGAMGAMGGGMAPPPEPGDDVSEDDYDPEDPNRHVQ